MNRVNKIYNNLKTPEQDGKKIGLFRTLCSIFGGLIVAYLAMTTLVFFIPDEVSVSIILPLLFNTLAWAVAALWIVIAPTKLASLERVIIPSFIFILIMVIVY